MDRQLMYLIAFVLITALTLLNLVRYKRAQSGGQRVLYRAAVALWVAYALVWFLLLR